MLVRQTNSLPTMLFITALGGKFSNSWKGHDAMLHLAVAWHGLAQHGLAHHGMAQRSMARHGTAQHKCSPGCASAAKIDSGTLSQFMCGSYCIMLKQAAFLVLPLAICVATRRLPQNLYTITAAYDDISSLTFYTLFVFLGTLPSQGSFVLTPGTAAIPFKELSLNPYSGVRAAHMSREISLNPQIDLGIAGIPGKEPRSDTEIESTPSLLVGLSQSPAVFEFARSPAAGHVKTAKLSQPNLSPPQAAKLPRAEFGIPRASQQGRAVHSSLAEGLVKNPRTSLEDLSQMQNCLNQLEQRLVEMPRPASRGQGSKPQMAEAGFANPGGLHTDRPTLHLHMQEPGVAAFGIPFGMPNAAGSSDMVSFLRPASLTPRQDMCGHDQQPRKEVASPSDGGEDEDRGSRPSSAGSVAQQPQFAALKARVNARRHGKS